MDLFAQQEDFLYHRVAGGSGSGTSAGKRLLLISQSMSPNDFSEDSNGAGGLQGLSPGSGQGTYGAHFRPPCPHPHQYTGAECSTGSIFDATSPHCGGIGVSGSILSPDVGSVETTSSLWVREEGESAGVRKHDKNKEGENVIWGGGADDDMEDEGDSKAKDWEEGEKEESSHGRRQFGLLQEDGERAASAAPEDRARHSSSRQVRGPATRYDIQWSQIHRDAPSNLLRCCPQEVNLASFCFDTSPLRKRFPIRV